MEILLKKLIELLEEGIETFGSLLPVFKKEKEAVLTSDLNELKKTLLKKEEMMLNMRSLEKRRTHIMMKLAKQLKLSPDELTLDKLAQSAQNPYSIHLKNCGLKLLKLTKNIKKVNHANRGLLAHSLGFVKNALTLLQNIFAPGQVYHRTGKVEADQPSGKVLSGEI